MANDQYKDTREKRRFCSEHSYVLRGFIQVLGDLNSENICL